MIAALGTYGYILNRIVGEFDAPLFSMFLAKVPDIYVDARVSVDRLVRKARTVTWHASDLGSLRCVASICDSFKRVNPKGHDDRKTKEWGYQL